MKNLEPLISDEWQGSGTIKKKDTKKWCRGKVGVEHTPIVIIDKNYSYREHLGKPLCTLNQDGTQRWMDCSHEVVCEACGRKLLLHPEVCPTTGIKIG